MSQWQRGGFRRFIAELMRFVARFADHGAGNQRRPPERVVASNIFPLRVVFMVALVSGGDSMVILHLNASPALAPDNATRLAITWKIRKRELTF